MGVSRFANRWGGICLLVAMTCWLGMPLQAVVIICAHAPKTYAEVVNDPQPQGLTMTLALPKDRFFLGEEIPATLTITNNSGSIYSLSPGRKDRSDMMDTVMFFAWDEKGNAVADPLAWYFQRSGGLTSIGFDAIDLGQAIVKMGVNPWVRFDRPGTYTLRAWTSGASRTKGKDMMKPSSSYVQLLSNPVTLTIEERTPAQEQAILDEARRVLALEKDKSPWSTFSPEAAAALHRLCALQTPAARAMLFPYLDRERLYSDVYISQGVLSGQDANTVALELRASILRGVPVLNPFAVRLYAALKTKDFPEPGFLDMHMVGFTSPFEKAFDAAKQELTDSARNFSGGQGEVFIGALWTAFLEKPQDPVRRKALVAHQLEMLPEQRERLIDSWKNELPHLNFNIGLGDYEETVSRMPVLGGLDLLPVLIKTASAPDFNPYALEILVKLAPDQAKPLVIADILRDKSGYFDKAKIHYPRPIGLEDLPREKMPQLTSTFRRKMLRPDMDPEMLFPLIDRYGTPDLLPDVEACHQRRREDFGCAAEGAYVSFYIGCNPATGWTKLAEQIKARHDPRFYAFTLDDIFSRRWDDAALPLLQDLLQSDHHQLVMATIRVLKTHADGTVIESVIAALERIHLKFPPKLKDETAPEYQRSMECQLASSLLRSNRWTYSDEQKKRLETVAAAK